MEIIFSKGAFGQLSKLEKGLQQRIVNKLDFFLSQENPLDFAEKLTDHSIHNIIDSSAYIMSSNL